MAYYWLDRVENDIVVDTLDLGLNVQDMTIGGNKRNYKVTPYVGAHGGFITGFGTVSPKKFTFSRREKVEGSDATAWNSERNEFQKWFTGERTEDIYLNIRNGEDTYTIRGLVYCTDLGADKFTQQRITGMRKFQMIAPAGLLEKTTDEEPVAPIAVIAGNNSVVVVNNGDWSTPIICKYTPTGAESKFGVQIVDQFGFVLEKTNFDAGTEIIYNTANNGLTIGGAIQKTSNFLTGGSPFNLPKGTKTLKVTVSGPGFFEYVFTERYS